MYIRIITSMSFSFANETLPGSFKDDTPRDRAYKSNNGYTSIQRNSSHLTDNHNITLVWYQLANKNDEKNLWK